MVWQWLSISAADKAVKRTRSVELRVKSATFQDGRSHGQCDIAGEICERFTAIHTFVHWVIPRGFARRRLVKRIAEPLSEKRTDVCDTLGRLYTCAKLSNGCGYRHRR